MDSFDVTPAELQACGSMLTDISREAHAELKIVVNQANELLGDGWQGEAARGFADGWEQWRAGAHDVLEALADMGRLLGSTGQHYDVTDEHAAAEQWRLGEAL